MHHVMAHDGVMPPVGDAPAQYWTECGISVAPSQTVPHEGPTWGSCEECKRVIEGRVRQECPECWSEFHVDADDRDEPEVDDSAEETEDVHRCENCDVITREGGLDIDAAVGDLCATCHEEREEELCAVCGDDDCNHRNECDGSGGCRSCGGEVVCEPDCDDDPE